MIVFLGVIVWFGVVVFVVCLCVLAGRADRMVDRWLGPASSDVLSEGRSRSVVERHRRTG